MNRALLSAIALCFAAGCDQKPAEPPKPKTAAVIPLPAEAPKPAPASAGQDATPAQVAQKAGTPGKTGRAGCGKGKCKVKLTIDDSVTPCRVTYNAEHLSVYGENNTVSWHATGGWKFDKNGIDLPMGGGQFTNPQGEGSPTYSWDDMNNDTKQYKYTINLKKGTKTCKVDPSIVNGADSEDPNYPPP